jgi:ATP-dependent Clp protease protease subunit
MKNRLNSGAMLAKVVVDNASATDRKIRVVASSEDEESVADLYLYDVIDSYWGVSAKAFIEALVSTKAKRINLRINSPGGDVFEARAMVTALREARAQGREVVAYVDGLAASAASYLALGAGRVVMADGAFYMVHKAWTMAIGNADDIRDQAAVLDKVDESIVDEYERKTGKPRDEIVAWMAAETWFSASEALAAGFVDEVTGDDADEGKDSKASARAWKLDGFNNAPKSLTEPEKTTVEDAGLRAYAGRLLAWLGATAVRAEPSPAEQAFAARRAAARRVHEYELAGEIHPLRSTQPSA